MGLNGTQNSIFVFAYKFCNSHIISFCKHRSLSFLPTVYMVVITFHFFLDCYFRSSTSTFVRGPFYKMGVSYSSLYHCNNRADKKYDSCFFIVTFITKKVFYYRITFFVPRLFSFRLYSSRADLISRFT